MAKRSKKTNRLKGRKRKVLTFHNVISLIVLALFIGFLYLGYLTLNDLMRLREIRIYGNRVISKEEIQTRAGLKKGMPILRINGEDVRQRLMELRWFEEVSVRKEPPWRILIKVKEKTPVAIVRTRKGLYLADSAGMLIERIDKGVTLLPVINVPLQKKETFYSALYLSEIIRDSTLFEGKTVTITGNSPESLSLDIDGLRVFIGKGGYLKKLEKLVKIQRVLKERGIPVEYVDLRFKERAIVRTRRVSIDG